MKLKMKLEAKGNVFLLLQFSVWNNRIRYNKNDLLHGEASKEYL